LRIHEVADRIFAIEEPGHVQSYLVTGERRSALIDTGLGLAPLRPVLQDRARPEIVVLSTHWHFDHVMGNPETDSDTDAYRQSLEALLDRGDAIQQILPGHNRYPLAPDWPGKAHQVFSASRENQATAEITTAWGAPIHRHHGGPRDLPPPCRAPGASICPHCCGRRGPAGSHDPI
jgi:glyoxylase-like metal-dependent hydrolase (beta-lactamase superfamily II)